MTSRPTVRIEKSGIGDDANTRIRCPPDWQNFVRTNFTFIAGSNGTYLVKDSISLVVAFFEDEEVDLEVRG